MNKNKLIRQGLALEYVTLAWNVIGCIILILVIKSNSISLFSFGVDSVIEILASTVVIRQLRAVHKNKGNVAEKMIGVSFIFLSVYILVEIYFSIARHIRPETSSFGVIWLLVTAIAMFLLAYGKSAVGKELDNPVLKAEAKVTVIDGLLALSVLIGLLLNSYFGIWWADIAASLVIVCYGIREAIHTLS